LGKCILIRYGEIYLKGLNRPHFERLLLNGVKIAVRNFDGACVSKGEGRYYVRGLMDDDFPLALEALGNVFGIHSLSPAAEIEKDMEAICREAEREVRTYMQKYGKTALSFKVESKRSDKRFPKSSMEISAAVGEYLLIHVEGLTVDLHRPELRVYVEVREEAFVYAEILPGQGGLPMGSSGRAVLLLSGGIDSPVAGYMVAKRGVMIEGVHFHSFPYTSEQAKQKVITLARLLTKYTGPIMMHIVGFTEIQRTIYEKCPNEQLVILMRRFMMRIAERIANDCGALGIVTGESIGQVASQTLESMNVTGSVVNLPVFRPVVGMDKQEIVERALKIGTYETSILPYEDCCTVFVPKHPVIRPSLEKILKSEALLDVDALIEAALEQTETILVK